MAEKQPTVHLRALERAADILGGTESLREYLRVPMTRLEAWLAGEPPPMDIFLRAVDVISAAAQAKAAEQRTHWQKHADRIDESVRAVDRARRVQAIAMAARDTARALRRKHLPIRFLDESFADAKTMLAAALDAAMEATHTDMGNVQLARPDGLHIVAQRGFEQPFLDYFAIVGGQTSACGRALAIGRRVIVDDVARDQNFVGTLAGEMMQAAGALACQSTPLVATSGEVLGVISTHFRKPRVPEPEECASVDYIARRAAQLLETAPP